MKIEFQKYDKRSIFKEVVLDEDKYVYVYYPYKNFDGDIKNYIECCELNLNSSPDQKQIGIIKKGSKIFYNSNYRKYRECEIILADDIDENFIKKQIQYDGSAHPYVPLDGGGHVTFWGDKIIVYKCYPKKNYVTCLIKKDGNEKAIYIPILEAIGIIKKYFLKGIKPGQESLN